MPCKSQAAYPRGPNNPACLDQAFLHLALLGLDVGARKVADAESQSLWFCLRFFLLDLHFPAESILGLRGSLKLRCLEEYANAVSWT